MTVLGPREIRARHRPLVVLSIAAVRLLCGFCLALPLASLVAESGIGQAARGDRVLFESGGYLLLELLRVQGPNLAAAARGMVPLLLLGLLVTAACNAALLVALNLGGRLQLGAWLSRVLGSLPALVVLGIGAALVQLVIVLVGLLLVDGLPTSMTRPVAASAAQAGVALAVGLLAGAAGGLADVAKAALVRNAGGLRAALRHALACARRAPLAASLGWLPYALVLAAAWLGAAHLSQALDVSAPGAWRVAIVFALHQAVSLASVALRAGWYASSLRLVASH